MAFGDGLQYRAAFAARIRKIVVAERRVSDHRDVMLRAPRHHRMLDRAFLQMVEHLVAGDLALACDIEKFVEIASIEIGNTPRADLAGADQLVERLDGLGERIAAAPMQEIAIEMIGLQPRQRTLARRDRT